MKPRTDNANNVDVRIVPSGTGTGSVGDITIGTTTGTTVSASNVASTYTSFSLTNNISKSGYLEVFSDGVRSLNNINNNNAYGTAKNNSNEQLTVTNAEVTEYNKAYNREPDYYTTKNVQLTDDRYLIMWDMHQTNVQNGYYPVMVMEGDNPVFGYIDNNGGGPGVTGAPAANAYYQRAKFNTDGTVMYKEYLSKSLAADQMGMAKDEGNRYLHASVSNYSGEHMALFYDRFSALHNNNVWSGDTAYTTFNGTRDSAANNNALVIDTIGTSTGRFQYPKLVAKGNSVTGTASMYMAYYDAATGNIYLRNFQIAAGQENYTSTANNISFAYNASIDIYNYYSRTSSGTAENVYTITGNTNYDGNYVSISGNYYKLTRTAYYGYRTTTQSYYYTVEGYNGNETFSSNVYTRTVTAPQGFTQLYSGGTDNNGNAFMQYVNFAEGTTDYTARKTVTTSGNKYYDMVVTEDYHVVIIFYNEDDSCLKMVYSKYPVTGSNPTANIEWEESSVTFPEYVGNYVSMTVDSNSGIHISAFDVTDSDLSYIYLSSYDADSCTHMTVDQFGSVGNWTKIKVDSNNVPYIAYTNATENGQRDAVKLAYADASAGYAQKGIADETRYTTGHWEYMNVPAITPPQGGDMKFQNVCLDFDTSGNPVIGYLGTNLEFGKQLSE